jgi:PTH1 family peptidyl-tRNA hydrolase
MRVILGIGNPGREYDGTRHNLGFQAVDVLARRHGASFAVEKRFQAEVATWESPAGRVLLVKPRTYVNLSGETAQSLLAFHKLPTTDLLVLVDDLNLPTGHLRLRADGSAGGHNGLKDIAARLGPAYARLRLGCGPLPPGADQVGFVLGGFRPEERADAEKMVGKAADAAEAWVRDGVVVACRFNGPLVAPEKPPRPAPVPKAPAPPAQSAAPAQQPPEA